MTHSNKWYNHSLPFILSHSISQYSQWVCVLWFVSKWLFQQGSKQEASQSVKGMITDKKEIKPCNALYQECVSKLQVFFSFFLKISLSQVRNKRNVATCPATDILLEQKMFVNYMNKGVQTFPSSFSSLRKHSWLWCFTLYLHLAFTYRNLRYFDWKPKCV